MKTHISEKTQKIIDYSLRNPCLLLQDVADKFGVSRQRVWEIRKRGNIPTEHYIPKRYCTDCGKEIYLKSKSGLCVPCRKKYIMIPLVCDYCGKTFYRRKSDVLAMHKDYKKYEHVYCNKTCRSRGMWKNRKEQHQQ